MPGMDGVQFLTRARTASPRSVRMLLTGYADINTAIDAVNKSNIFRLIIKPCPTEELAAILSDGVEWHRLMMAEKELLEKTLSGSIKVLTDVLTLVSPRAFSHASRTRRAVKLIAKDMGIENTWLVEIAAMLSQIGCVTIPDAIIEKVFSRKPLSDAEREMYDTYPKVGADIIKNIPRMEKVARTIELLNPPIDSTGRKDVAAADLPIEVKILQLALDHDLLVMSGLDTASALVEINKRDGRYDPKAVKALEKIISVENKYEIKQELIENLTEKMILMEDLITKNNVLVVSKGDVVTQSMKLRLLNFKSNSGIQDYVRVIVSKD
jgi:response regulator RpfG family c-di-GMP phosphodiesterase